MFQTQDEYQKYLELTKERCPEAPAMWEKVTRKSPFTDIDTTSYCRGWFKVAPDYVLLDKHRERDSSLSRRVLADCRDRLEKKQVRVQFCTRQEATHVELNGGGIVWIGNLVRYHELADIDQARIRHDEELAASFVEGAEYERSTAYAN